MKILQSAVEIAKKAGKILLEQAGQKLEISEKSKNDLVTSADHASEKLIINEIKNAYPNHTIIAEESASDYKSAMKSFLNSRYIWIIDPLDGTTNYAHGLPLYAVSIGIFKTKSAESSKNYAYLAGEMVAGVVYAPKLDELFTAEKGKGAQLNGQPIHVSPTTKIEKSLTVTGFPPVHKERNIPYFTSMVHKSRAVRRLGSASLDLCYVAAGRFDIFWEFGLKPWDIAAGALIIEEAGGHISDTNGNPLDLFGSDILATNGQVHHKVVELFKSI